MQLNLKGRRAVVLGGTRGIGRAIADTLADEGADIAICARNAAQVAEAAEALMSKGVRAVGRGLDLTNGEAVKAWIGDVANELGGIDILVSNAGAMAQGGDPASWEQNFRLDVLAAVNAFEAAKPHLLAGAEANGDASFVMISSVSAAETDNGGSYGPIKASLIHWGKGLARQYASKKLRTNVVSPGAIYFEGGVWQMIEKNMPDMFKGMMQRMPTGRMGTPQDIANAAVFLASPAASYVTGVNLVVDGAASRRVNF
ncbi:MAG TPA: SDR family oxidoreductase [Caulobacteraceae bacterium]|jgi:3-oxoacyl-[acyl-carrier protein] reductase|nr:SDR family oxidoreductase [Caulobacteraceae bacterium]